MGLVTLRCKSPQILNLHSSCQIRWQFVILLMSFFHLSKSSCILKKNSSIFLLTLLHLQIVHREFSIYTSDERQTEQKKLHDCIVFIQLRLFFPTMLQFSQKSSKKLKRDTVLIGLKENGNKTRQNKVNKVYKAILTGNTSDS